MHVSNNDRPGLLVVERTLKYLTSVQVAGKIFFVVFIKECNSLKRDTEKPHCFSLKYSRANHFPLLTFVVIKSK